MLDKNGAIAKALEAREATNIANEKEAISMAVFTIKADDKKITQENLQEALNNTTRNKETRVEDTGDDYFLVFFSSKRVYEVDENGNINYLGKENEIDKVIITVDKEKDLEPKQIQQVQINVKKYKVKEDETLEIKYAWGTSKTEEPDVNEYKTAKLEENSSGQIAVISSGEIKTGTYYLWIKVNIGNTEEIKKVYGEYKIQEYATLINASQETDENSGFLGNTDIQRGNIKSITFTNNTSKPNDENVKSWNPGTKDGIIQAWYTTETNGENTYYNVTIAQEGGVKANSSLNNLFRCVGNNVEGEVKINGLNYLDTSGVLYMDYMFYNCKKINSLDVSSFNTSNVTNMRNMFDGCISLIELNVNGFDTSKVKLMWSMFQNCSSLTNLDLSSFNTENVQYMGGMFKGCTSLESLKGIEKFSTKNVQSMADMFNGCEKLENLDLSSFKTESATVMGYLFYNCKKLSSLDLSNFNSSCLSEFNAVFYGCENLGKLDLRNFDFTNITKMWWTFRYCDKLKILDLRDVIVPEGKEGLYFAGLTNDCEILVSSKRIKEWVLSANSKFSNIKIMDSEGNIIEDDN